MPLGAEVLAGRGIRFQFWAPGAARVDLCLDGQSHATRMARDAGGWTRLVTDRARQGTRYRYRIDGGTEVPDPAPRFQPEDVHGPSEVVDPEQFEWTDGGWPGLRWEALVFYELHVGTFTGEGTFGARPRRVDAGRPAHRLGAVSPEPRPDRQRGLRRANHPARPRPRGTRRHRARAPGPVAAGEAVEVVDREGRPTLPAASVLAGFPAAFLIQERERP